MTPEDDRKRVGDISKRAEAYLASVKAARQRQKQDIDTILSSIPIPIDHINDIDGANIGMITKWKVGDIFVYTKYDVVHSRQIHVEQVRTLAGESVAQSAAFNLLPEDEKTKLQEEYRDTPTAQTIMPFSVYFANETLRARFEQLKQTPSHPSTS